MHVGGSATKYSEWVRMFLTALAVAVMTVAVIGGARSSLSQTVWGDQVVQHSCAPEDGTLRGFCVQRHRYPAIPLLRDERRTVQIYPEGSPRTYVVADPFWATTDISWRDDGVALTDRGGCSLTFSTPLLLSIGD